MDQNPVVLVNEYKAQQAREARDYAKAVEYTILAREAAIAGGDTWGYCRSSYNIAHLQYALSQISDCVNTIEALVAHPAVADYPELVAQAKILLAHALQDSGANERAAGAVEEAAGVVPEQPGQLRLKLQHSLVSTLAEKGDVEAAWREALVLDELIGEEAGAKASGIAHWSIGNAAFMSGRIDEGRAYHQKAARSLVTVGDVKLWALFNKAATNMRLDAGLIDRETLDCLERAEVAISVVDGNIADKLEILLARGHWEYASGNAAAAEEKLREVAARTKARFPYIHAQSLQLLSACLLEAGRKGEALKLARESRGIYLETGAAERAAQASTLIDTIQQAAQQ